MEITHNTPIYIIVYRPKGMEDSVLFRTKLSMSFAGGASISNDVYLVAKENSDVNTIVQEIVPYAKGAFFVSQLKEPYSTKGYSTNLDMWFEKYGKNKVREENVRDFIKKVLDT